MTRVHAKNSSFTAYVMQTALDIVTSMPDVRAKTDKFSHWSDGPPHYKSRIALSFFKYYWPKRYDIHTSLSFGMPNHLKGIIDRQFSVDDKRIAEHAQEHVISTMKQVAELLRAAVAATILPCMQEIVVEFTPEIHRSEWMRLHRPIKRASLPSRIFCRSCHRHNEPCHFTSATKLL